MVQTEPFEECAAAFLRRDYPVAASIALRLLKTGVNPGLAQILLISMRRMGLVREIQEIGATLLVNARGDPWQTILLELTMGKRDPDSVLEAAQDDLQRCQALCYRGSHLITTGDIAQGEKALRECLEMNVDCFERHIASMETEMVDRWITGLEGPDAEVDRFRRVFLTLRSKGLHRQAVHYAHLALSIALRHHGEFHAGIGERLNELAMAYVAAEDYERAEPLLSKALELVGVLQGVSSEYYAIVLDNIAFLKSKMGQFQEAEKIHRTSLDLLALATGEEHPSYAKCLENLALVCRKLGKFDESERLYLKAVQIHALVYGTDDPRYVGVLDKLANLYVEMGRFRDAEVRMEEGLDICRRTTGQVSLESGSRLKQLANLYSRLGRHSDAVELLGRAVGIEKMGLGLEHPTTTETLAALSLQQKLAGQLDEAIQGYKHVISMQSKLLGSTSPQVAATQLNLGKLYVDQGHPILARMHLEEALEICRSSNGEDSVEYALALLGIAYLESSEGKHREAEPMLRRALETVERHVGHEDQHFAPACEALARCCVDLGRFDEAERLLELSLAIKEEAVGGDNPSIASTLCRLGILEATRGHWTRAEERLQRGTRLLGRAPDANRNPEYAAMLTALGSVLIANARESEAVNVLLTAERHKNALVQVRLRAAGFQGVLVDQPLELLSLLRDPKVQSPELIRDLLNIVWRRKGVVADAELFLKRDATRSNRDNLSDRQRANDEILRRVKSGAMPETPELEGLLEAVARSRRDEIHPLLAEAQLEFEQTLLEDWPEQGDLSRETWFDKLKEHVASVGSRIGKRDRLDELLRAALPDNWLVESLESVGTDRVASQLPEESALVEFLRASIHNARPDWEKGETQWGSAHYYAFVLKSGSPEDVRLIDIGDAQVIDEKVQRLRSLISRRGALRDLQVAGAASSEPREAVIAVGTELRAALFDPLQPALAGRKHLLLAPDGQLWTLPFEILPLDRDRFLIDDYETTYLSTGRDLITTTNNHGERCTDPVVVADPAYDLVDSKMDDNKHSASATEASERQASDHEDDLRGAGLRFDPLPGTRSEGLRVAELLGVSAWLGGNALKARVKQNRSPLVLHIATHGYFLEDQPELEKREPTGIGRRVLRPYSTPLLNSGVALAGANTWLRRGELPELAEDGLLTAADVAAMDLSGTQLVVLSACETGLGELAVGQGVYGLRRSARLAGARTLVMSLWKVPDRETQEMMEDFYSRLQRGEPCGGALRAARLGVKARRPDPFYWGAFFCEGESGPIQWGSP